MGNDERVKTVDGRTVDDLAVELLVYIAQRPAHWQGGTLREFCDVVSLSLTDHNTTKVSAALNKLGYAWDETRSLYCERGDISQAAEQTRKALRERAHTRGLYELPPERETVPGLETYQDWERKVTSSVAQSVRRRQPTLASAASWTHPTGGAPRTVLICGLGPTKHNLIELQTGHDGPWWGVNEVWGVNAGGVNWFNGRVFFDMLWILDYLDGEAAKYAEYPERIRQYAERHYGTHKRIMTTIAGHYSDIAIEYPLIEIAHALEQINDAPLYLRNSLPMMLAYAWFIGVETVYLFGVDYNHPALGNVREEHRANCEYWVGWLRAEGVKVVVPDTTTLLCTNEPFTVYGYPPGPDRHPRVRDGRLEIPGGAHGSSKTDGDVAGANGGARGSGSGARVGTADAGVPAGQHAPTARAGAGNGHA